jgi:hypothetical protein
MNLGLSVNTSTYVSCRRQTLQTKRHVSSQLRALSECKLLLHIPSQPINKNLTNCGAKVIASLQLYTTTWIGDWLAADYFCAVLTRLMMGSTGILVKRRGM